MKKLLHSIVGITFLASMVVTHMPMQAGCMMTMASVGTYCTMPACQHCPLPAQCPKLQVAPVRDALLPTFTVNHAGLQVIHLLSSVALDSATRWTAPLRHLKAQIDSVFCFATPPGRAPPADAILLSA